MIPLERQMTHSVLVSFPDPPYDKRTLACIYRMEGLHGNETNSVYIAIVKRVLCYLPVQLLHTLMCLGYNFSVLFQTECPYFVTPLLLDVIFYLQPTVVILLSQKMVLLSHFKTHWRELRYSSDVTQDLSQLGG